MDINFSALTDLNILFVLNTILSLFFVYLLVKSNASYAKKMVVVPLIIFYMFYSLFTVSNLMGYPYRTEEPVAEFFMIGYKVEMHNDEKRIILWAHPVGSEKSRLYSEKPQGAAKKEI